jgi:outer membrane protein OmpA-like peptidoglycan-associated protein
LSNLRAENAGKLAAERAAFEAGLEKQRLGAADKAAKLAAYGREAEARAKQLEGQLGGLAGKIKDAEGQLAAARDAQGKLEARTRVLAQEKQALGTELQGAQERLNAKKNLIDKIKKNFAKAGIKATVDDKTGDVVIDFGQEYFDTGSAELKGGMLNTITKLIPTYSRSLFEDAKTAEKIANVEIVGFASSTYKGKYVNPKSLKPANQEAINYNLKLSFSRANEIFKTIFNPAKMSFEHQKKLLPLVKVVGRGFLPEGLNAEDLPESMPEKEFCEKYQCKKAQKVIVRFNLKD